MSLSIRNFVISGIIGVGLVIGFSAFAADPPLKFPEPQPLNFPLPTPKEMIQRLKEMCQPVPTGPMRSTCESAKGAFTKPDAGSKPDRAVADAMVRAVRLCQQKNASQNLCKGIAMGMKRPSDTAAFSRSVNYCRRIGQDAAKADPFVQELCADATRVNKIPARQRALRAEGIAEVGGDLLVVCSGGAPLPKAPLSSSLCGGYVTPKGGTDMLNAPAVTPAPQPAQSSKDTAKGKSEKKVDRRIDCHDGQQAQVVGVNMYCGENVVGTCPPPEKYHPVAYNSDKVHYVQCEED